MNETIVENIANNRNPKKTLSENGDVATLIRFMQQIKIPELFARLPDSRQQKITYSLSSLALWSFATCIFRQGSKHAFHTTLEQLSLEQREGVMHFLGITGKDFPHPSTVDDSLAHLHYEDLNQMLLEMFDQMNIRKLFYNHAATLLPDNTYYIGTDGHHSTPTPALIQSTNTATTTVLLFAQKTSCRNGERNGFLGAYCYNVCIYLR